MAIQPATRRRRALCPGTDGLSARSPERRGNARANSSVAATRASVSSVNRVGRNRLLISQHLSS